MGGVHLAREAQRRKLTRHRIREGWQTHGHAAACSGRSSQEPPPYCPLRKSDGRSVGSAEPGLQLRTRNGRKCRGGFRKAIEVPPKVWHGRVQLRSVLAHRMHVVV